MNFIIGANKDYYSYLSQNIYNSCSNAFLLIFKNVVPKKTTFN